MGAKNREVGKRLLSTSKDSNPSTRQSYRVIRHYEYQRIHVAIAMDSSYVHGPQRNALMFRLCIPLSPTHATQDECGPSTMPLLPGPMSLQINSGSKSLWSIPESKKQQTREGGQAYHGKNSKTTGQGKHAKLIQTTGIVVLWKEGLC